MIQALPHICNSSYEVHLYHAAFTTAFFGFMRVGEITAEAKERLQRSVLQRSDIKFLEEAQLRALEISFHFSKNNQNGPPQVIVLPTQANGVLCPVTATQEFCDIRPATGASCHFDGSPVTRSQFGAILKRSVEFAGVAGSYFRSHSFRIGAASTTVMQGVPDWKIQEMGRWRSSTFKSYIRFPLWVNPVRFHCIFNCFFVLLFCFL